jgi:cell division protein ZapA (FtsZ GTPase activity inhibitor)
MERIKITICGRDFSLITDDSPEEIRRVAEKLEEKIAEFSALRTRSAEEMLTLVALNVMNEAEKDMFAVKNVIGELHRKVSALEQEVADTKESDRKALDENVTSAAHELEQIAQVKDERNEFLMQKIAEQEQQIERIMNIRENEIKRLNEAFDSAYLEMGNIAQIRDDENAQLRIKISDYESNMENLMKEREVEIKRLHEGFESATKEMAYIAQVKETENNTLRSTLSTYEATFDNYVKLKEEEIVRLRVQLEEAVTEREIFKAKLSLKSGGQLMMD